MDLVVATSLIALRQKSPQIADSTLFYQHMEGQNLQAIKKGTSEAKPLSASFYVRSNLTGTATVELVDNDTSSYRTCSQSYTINSANTWEHKTVTFPADTTGPFDNDNASSMYFAFILLQVVTIQVAHLQLLGKV